MRNIPVHGATSQSEITRAIERSLTLVRWCTLVALFLLSLAQPHLGRAGLPSWALVLVFIVYNGTLTLLRLRVSWLRSRAFSAVLDFLLATALYTVAANPSGTLYILFLLVTVWAAATVSLRQSLVHTIAAIVIVTAISPTLPLWIPRGGGIRDLLARLIVLALVSTTAALLVHHVEQEHAAARSSQADAERQAELNRLIGVFISSISHDLRTPLTALRSGLGMLEMSTRERLQADERQLLAAARRNSERLSLLIDDLLTYNQLEAHALTLATELVFFDTIASAAVSTLKSLISEKRQHLVVNLPTPLPCLGDARRLEQVVVNLVANANAHTPPGTRIEVSGSTEASEVRLTVSDDGPGMAQAELERAFERFQCPAGQRGGCGLGLSIAKSVVELHGGRIWIESGPGKGTRMHVALPSGVCPAPQEVEVDVPQIAHSGRYA